MGSGSHPMTVWSATPATEHVSSTDWRNTMLYSEQDHIRVARASLVKVVQGVMLPVGLQMSCK